MSQGLEDRLKQVKDDIALAAQRSGRSPQEITLVAISKKFPPETILEAYNLGHRHFGENRPQELRDKAPDLPDDIIWHFVGNLQSNKIKYVLPASRLIHSVNSEKLAGQIAAYAEKNDIMPDVLIEVHNGLEESKAGLSAEIAEDVCLQLYEEKRLRVKGLMVMAPFSDNEKRVRPAFERLRRLRETLQKVKGADSFPWLSMGMSNDFKWAIEEGSTHVRIGTAIFGPRRR